MFRIALSALLLVTACSAQNRHDSADHDPQTAFFAALETLCTGKAYAGTLVSDDAVDAGFRAATLIIGPARCASDQIDIPLSVGEDRSRIWQISHHNGTLRLKHDHTHADGKKDILTQYGGDAADKGRADRQTFPVDAETRKLFTDQNIEVSNQNIWALEIRPGQTFAYEMSRPQRFFRLEFDLSQAVEAPPLPWALAPVGP